MKGGWGGINDDKNMVQIHDEQRSIQMTMLHIYIYIGPPWLVRADWHRVVTVHD